MTVRNLYNAFENMNPYTIVTVYDVESNGDCLIYKGVMKEMPPSIRSLDVWSFSIDNDDSVTITLY